MRYPEVWRKYLSLRHSLVSELIVLVTYRYHNIEIGYLLSFCVAVIHFVVVLNIIYLKVTIAMYVDRIDFCVYSYLLPLFYERMVIKLAVWELRRGVGRMDYIHSLLIKEDDLENPDNTGGTNFNQMAASGSASRITDPGSSDHGPSPRRSYTRMVCACDLCRLMPQEIESKCCKQKSCTTKFWQTLSWSRCVGIMYKKHKWHKKWSAGQ